MSTPANTNKTSIASKKEEGTTTALAAGRPASPHQLDELAARDTWESLSSQKLGVMLSDPGEFNCFRCIICIFYVLVVGLSFHAICSCVHSYHLSNSLTNYISAHHTLSFFQLCCWQRRTTTVYLKPLAKGGDWKISRRRALSGHSTTK